MSAPTRVLPAADDDAGWTPELVAEIAGVTVDSWACCGQLVGEFHHCDEDWVRDAYPLPAHFFGRSA